MGKVTGIKPLLLHLRLKWQVVLMPIFLWGFALSDGRIGPKFWVGLFVFHVLCYGGSTAFNSYYDQDQGPVGGLWDPPRPTRALLFFSLAVQILGLIIIALFLSLPLLIVALAMLALSTAYSHPAIRLKAHPWASLLAISVGQGLGGATAGWLCAQGDWTTLLAPRAALALIVAALITTGFYPLTQLYQRAEDERRGDITFAVRWGERSFPFAIACMASAAALGAFLTGYYYGLLEGAMVGIALLTLAGLIYEWWRHFDEGQIRQNYRYMMRLGYLMGGGFALYIGWHLAHAI